jgi:hypothetical protein
MHINQSYVFTSLDALIILELLIITKWHDGFKFYTLESHQTKNLFLHADIIFKLIFMCLLTSRGIDHFLYTRDSTDAQLNMKLVKDTLLQEQPYNSLCFAVLDPSDQSVANQRDIDWAIDSFYNEVKSLFQTN